MKSRSRNWLIASLSLAAIVCVLLWRSAGSDKKSAPAATSAEPNLVVSLPGEPPAPPAISPAKSQPKQTEELEKAPALKKPSYARVTVKPGQPIPELFPHQAERDKIQSLATTYDVKNIPAIAAFLQHSEPTVRDAARQGLVQIGDPAAIPYLKNASDAAKDPEEAQSLRETIEFLSLPHFMDVVTMGANTTSQP